MTVEKVNYYTSKTTEDFNSPEHRKHCDEGFEHSPNLWDGVQLPPTRNCEVERLDNGNHDAFNGSLAALINTEKGREIIKNSFEFEYGKVDTDSVINTTVKFANNIDIDVNSEDKWCYESYSTDPDVQVYEIAVDKLMKQYEETELIYNEKTPDLLKFDVVRSDGYDGSIEPTVAQSLYYLTGKTPVEVSSYEEKLEYLKKFAENKNKDLAMCAYTSIGTANTYYDNNGREFEINSHKSYGVKAYDPETGNVTLKSNSGGYDMVIHENAFCKIFDNVIAIDLSDENENVNYLLPSRTFSLLNQYGGVNTYTTAADDDSIVYRRSDYDKDFNLLYESFNNEQGHALNTAKYDENGNKLAETAYTYFDDNKTLKTLDFKEYGENHKLSHVYNYKCTQDNGASTQDMKYNEDSVLISKKEEACNSKGQKMYTNEELYTEDGAYDGKLKTYYDNKGRVTTVYSYSPEDKLDRTDEYNYNNEGSIKVTKEYDENGQVDDADVTKYDENGNKDTIFNKIGKFFKGIFDSIGSIFG